MIDAITLLRTIGGSYYATKRHLWQPVAQKWETFGYNAGGNFFPSEHPVSSLSELASLIEKTRNNPYIFAIRGALAPHTKEALASEPNRLFRRKKTGAKAPFIEVSRYWVMLDIDSFPLFASEDLADDPEGPIDRAIHELLPECFHDADCFWQLSSSAGFVDGILKVHLWFWLSEPADSLHLRKVFEQHAPGVDRKPFNAVQPHYFADPVAVNGYDPLPRRTGFRKGLEPAVTLPPLKSDWKKPRPPRGTGGAAMGSSVDAALSLLGDGPGLTGFHETLRTATLLYARHCARYRTRDDEALKASIRKLIEDAPKKPGRSGWEEYKSDTYLDRLIHGAFALVATGDTDTPATMRPDVHAPTISVDQARDDLRNVIRGFLMRTTGWWTTDLQGYPEHGAVIVDVGVGKSGITREELPAFIAAQRAAGKPHRVLWLVPHHRLSEEAADAMRALGLNAAIMRGREAKVSPDSDEAMCLDLEAIADARLAGADVEHDVCGSGKEGKPSCPFRNQCAYQRQKVAVKSADVVIAAHQHLFHKLPSAMGKNFGLVVVDESWWQAGLNPNRHINAVGFEAAVIKNPVLRPDGQAQHPDHLATQELLFLARKAEAAFAATPTGDFITRATVTATGLTANEARTAAKLEWLRKRNPGIRPGMSAKSRKEAIQAAEVNSTLSRRSGIWRALAELLDSDQEASGRLQIRGDNDGRDLLLHSRHEIHESTADLPMLLLDATLPLKIVSHFLPRLNVLATVAVSCPYMIVNQVTGGWGKSSLTPHAKADVAENQRRDGVLAELRDFVAFHGDQSALVVTYEAIKNRFADLIGIRTAWFNALSGLDAFGNVNALFVIGRPLPSPSELRPLALALTGRVVPEENPGQMTRGALMADGVGRPLKVRAYADPDLEALRTAITDTEVVQAIGRGRGVNRTAGNPLTVWVLADVLLPHPLSSLAGWGDMRLNPIARMAARGLFLTSPSDAVAFFPDLFESIEAAKKVMQREGISGTFPYEGLPHRGMSPNSSDEPHRGNSANPPSEIRYRPTGRGQQTRRAWGADWRLETIRDDLEDVLGELALFEVVVEPTPPDQPGAGEQPAAEADKSPIGEIPPFPLLDDWELNPDNFDVWDELTDSARIALKCFHDRRMQVLIEAVR
jgi:hypothetical protein